MWITVLLLSIILYAASQIFEKLGSDIEEPHTELKFFVWYGIICLILSVGYSLFGFKEGDAGFLYILTNYPQALFSPLLYAVSLLASFVAFRHIPVYIESPASSTSGIFYLLEVIFLFKVTGREEFLDEIMNPVKMGLIIVILLLVFLCSLNEGESERLELNAENGNTQAGKPSRKPSRKLSRNPMIVIGALLAVFSAMTDAASSVVDAYYLSDIAESVDYICFHNCIMAAFALIAYLILWKKERKAYNPFKKSELNKMLGAGCDCFATVFYMLALSFNPVYSDALISGYFIFSILLSMLILKEKPNKKQYAYIILLVIFISAFIVVEEF